MLIWPFWIDVYNGNTMVFVFVAAAGALQRKPIATLAYIELCLLMPRPIMLPLLIWIVWHQPEWRLRSVALAGINGVAVLVTGYGVAWAWALFRVGDAVALSARDIGPAALFGTWWVVLGALLAVLFTIRGRLGWASMAASPYWLPQYLLMLALELVPSQPTRGSAAGQASDAAGEGEPAPAPSPRRRRLISGTRGWRDRR